MSTSNLSIALGLFYLVIVCDATSCFVGIGGVDGDNCGSSEAQACLTIQQCITMSANDSKQVVPTIEIHPGTYTGKGYCNLQLDGNYWIRSSVVGEKATIDCERKSRHFSVINSTLVTVFTDIEFIRGFVVGDGGCLWLSRSTRVEGCSFSGCTADRGGAIFFDGHALGMETTSFDGNQAIEGGAVFIDAGLTFSFESIYFHDNNGTLGGAAYLKSSGSINDTRFERNNADTGGAVYISTPNTGDWAFANSSFENNTASYAGGAMAVRSGVVTLQAVEFLSNSAVIGGGVLIEDPDNAASASLSLIDCTMKWNSAVQGAAAWIGTTELHSRYSVFDWGGTLITENTANFTGGIWVNVTEGTPESFVILGAQSIDNEQGDLGCSSQLIPFCVASPCTVVNCSACPGSCLQSFLGAAASIPANQRYCLHSNAIPCQHGTCIYESVADPLVCVCNDNWGGSSCSINMKTPCFLSNCWDWLTIVGGVIIVILGIIIVAIVRDRNKHGYMMIEDQPKE